MAKKEKTEEYVVLKKHTLNHKVGETIDLTESKAKALSGKIRLKSESVENLKASQDSKKLKKENVALNKEIEELTEANELLLISEEELKSEIVDLKSQFDQKSK